MSTLRELVEMGKSHPEWAKNYQIIAKSLDQQEAELKKLHHKVLSMRFQTAVIGLQYLKATKQLQLTKEKMDMEEAQDLEVPKIT